MYSNADIDCCKYDGRSSGIKFPGVIVSDLTLNFMHHTFLTLNFAVKVISINLLTGIFFNF